MPVSGRPKIGTQIAKIFPGWGLYLGQVVEIKEETYWVRYEDGEEEGFKREGIELLQTLLLYAEAEITTQVRNSRLRLREAGLMTEEEVSRAEREEEEAREEERRVKAEEEGEGGEEEGGEKEEEEVEEKEMATPSAARGSGGCTKGKHQKARKKKRYEEVVEIDGDDKDEGEVADGDVEVGEEVEDKDEKAIYLHCERCWCTFISEGGLVYHKNKDVCSQYKRKSTRNPTPEEMEGGEGGRQGLKCPVCERTFEGPNCLKYHLERAVGCVGGGREGGKKEEVEAVLLSLARPKESRKPPWRERGRRNGEEKEGEEDDADWRLREKRSKKAAALRKLMTTMVGDGMKEEEEEEEEGGEGGMKRRGGLRRRRAAIMGTTKAAKLAQREAKKKEKEESWGKKRRRVEEDGEEDGSEFSIVGEEESEEEGEEYNDEDVEGEEDQEEEEDEEGSVSVLAGNGKRRRRRFGGKEGWEGKRQMVMKGSKSRVVHSRVTVSLSGVEGLVDTGFDRGMLVVGEVEEGLRTDLKGLQLLLHHHRHHHQQQEVEVKEGGRAEEREEGPRRVHEVVDLSVWMLENGLEVASLPLKLVHKTRGPPPPPVLVDILPFHSLPSPFSFPSFPSSSSSKGSCSRGRSDKRGRDAEKGEADTDLLANAGGPVQSLDILPPPPPSSSFPSSSSSSSIYIALGTTSLTAAASRAMDVEILSNQASNALPMHIKGYPVTRQANLLQIWGRREGMGGKEMVMLYGVGHTFGPVWDVRWLPREVWWEEGKEEGKRDVLGALVAVFGDGRARVYLLPTPSSLPSSSSSSSSSAAPVVLLLPPLLEMVPPPGTCLTSVRVSPHDPGLLLCGATNGMALLYRLHIPTAAAAASLAAARTDSMHSDDLTSRPNFTPPSFASFLRPPPPHSPSPFPSFSLQLHPTRRFFDAREAPLPSLSSVDVIAWHPTHPHLFVAGGHDCALRLWDMRKPFRPLFEKSSFRLCACVMWLPNGVGCLAGFANGAVRILGLPEDVVKVRLYRHEAPVYDGVRGLDAVFLKGHVEKKRGGGKEEEEEEEEVERKEEEEGVVIATSGGNDGNFRVMVMDKEGLIPRRMGGQMTKTCLLTLMSVRGKSGATTAAAEAASGKKEEKGDDKEDDGRLTCELSWLRAPLKGESVEVSPAGVPDAPVRAGLAVTRVIIDEEGDPFAAVGGFSGLCRFVGLRAFLK